MQSCPLTFTNVGGMHALHVAHVYPVPVSHCQVVVSCVVNSQVGRSHPRTLEGKKYELVGKCPACRVCLPSAGEAEPVGLDNKGEPVLDVRTSTLESRELEEDDDRVVRRSLRAASAQALRDIAAKVGCILVSNDSQLLPG